LRAANYRDQLAPHIFMLDQVYRHKGDFDLIHFHTGYLHFPLSRCERLVSLTTIHGRLDLPEIWPLFELFKDLPLVSVSNSQRRPLAGLNWQGTVYHGLPKDRYRFSPRDEGYLAFLGRVCPEKGLDEAIEIAKLAGKKLKIAAKIDNVDRQYFNDVIRPLLDHPLIEFIGEIGYPDKEAFLGAASALLFPINWPEPFGL